MTSGRPKGSTDIVPRKQRDDMINFGQEHVEPGDNARYLRHALANMNMPPIDIADARQVEERIIWYFTNCANNDMKPTVKGLSNALGVDRVTMKTWANKEYRGATHSTIIKKAYNLLEELWEDYMQNGKINPVSGIFLGKNHFGMQDKTELVVTPNNPLGDYADPEDIIKRLSATMGDED